MAPDKSAKVEPETIVDHDNDTQSQSTSRRRSSEAREGSSGGSDTTTTAGNGNGNGNGKTPAKLRSVDFLTPEQLRRKREGDRLSQKHARQRTKALVEHLQARVQDLELQNSSFAHDLSAATAALAGCRCGRGPHSQNQIGHSGNTDDDKVTDAGSWQSDLGSETSSSTTTALSRTMRLDETGGNALEATLTQMIDGNFPGLDFTMWAGVSGFDDKAAAAFQPGLFTVPYTNGLSTGPVTAPTLPQQPPPQTQQPLPSPSPTNDAQLVHTATHGHAHAYHTIARGQHVWSTLPPHLAATCLLDEVVINLLQSRRPLESSGGNAQEFQRRTFPSIQSLLNPALSLASHLAEAEANASSSSASKASSPTSSVGPVTNTIVNKIIHVMTVPTLPEQIAILYVMSAVVRWLISPTESNYDSMPEWLRPTPSQLVEPHPPWIDLFVWPRGRERLCRNPRLHNQHALMSRLCNETISINWPHHPSDMILQTNGTEYVLNPIFDRHIKNIENWTVGKRVLQAFPEFVNDMNFR